MPLPTWTTSNICGQPAEQLRRIFGNLGVPVAQRSRRSQKERRFRCTVARHPCSSRRS